MKAPCKDCVDRYLACHDKCERYIQFRQERDNILAKMRQEKESVISFDPKRPNPLRKFNYHISTEKRAKY